MKGRVVFADVIEDRYDRVNKEYSSNEKPPYLTGFWVIERGSFAASIT